MEENELLYKEKMEKQGIGINMELKLLQEIKILENYAEIEWLQ